MELIINNRNLHVWKVKDGYKNSFQNFDFNTEQDNQLVMLDHAEFLQLSNNAWEYR